MLHTNLIHVLSAEEHQKIITENKNVMICCGRMGPMCIPVYAAMKNLETDYPHVKFADMEFDIPDASVIRDATECWGFMGLPFTIYYKNGEIVKATSGIQSEVRIKEILDEHFG